MKLITNSWLRLYFNSDEDTDIKALVNTWLSGLPETEQHILSGWIEDHFYRAVDWVLKQVWLP